MTSVPERLRIDGNTWTVHLEVHDDMEADETGLCFKADREIYIRPRMSRSETELTLVHEILHAMLPHRMLARATEERIVGRLESPVRQLLRLRLLDAPSRSSSASSKSRKHGRAR